jgi:hypothetical protein
MRRIAQLHADREIEARRPAAEYSHIHRMISLIDESDADMATLLFQA